MTKKKNRYATDFSTFREFRKIYESIPREAKYTWAENLTKEQMKLADTDGICVAHVLARSLGFPRNFCRDADILGLTNKDGETTAHILVPQEYFLWNELTPKILLLKNREGISVAREMIECNCENELFGFLDSDGTSDHILLDRDADGKTILHVLAERGNTNERLYTREFLGAADDNGWTVAHELIMRGAFLWEFFTRETAEIINTGTDDFISCAESIFENFDTIPEPYNKRIVDSIIPLIDTKTLLSFQEDFLAEENQNMTFLLETLKKELDQRTEQDIFNQETSPDEEPDLYSGGQEELYEMERG